MSHVQAYEYSAVRPVFLLRRVIQVDESQRLIQQYGELIFDMVRLTDVARWQGVVVKSDSIADRYEQ